MANYDVQITNGTGSQSMKKGTYNVSATASGYDTSTLDPKTFSATDSTGSQTFTISATGTLTLTVNETGASGGTPVTSGSIVMTDATGNTQYGQAVNIDSSGIATFANVPFGTTDEPVELYFKQLSTDDNHNIFEEVKTVSMTSDNQTEYIQNTLIAVQTFTLNDANYSGLPINGSLNFTEAN